MQMNSFRVDVFHQPEEALKAFSENQYAICIISIESSSFVEEFSLAKTIKSINANVILIFIGANLTPDIIAQAFSLGADDVIRKPLILEEVQLRLQAMLRRAWVLNQSKIQTFIVGKYSFDSQKQLLTTGDVCIKLTTKETDLLKYLCENKNTLVSRENILKTVWRSASFSNARSMDIYITKLRRLLQDDPSVSIVNTHGKGYKLQDNVNQVNQ
jgi:DNA-binding response OmpR family regulator